METVFHRAGRRAVALIGAIFALQLLCGCDYARMREDEALRTFEIQLPEMPKKTIPINGGIEVLRQTNPLDLQNPLPTTPEVVAAGAQRYAYYCVQCHGPKLNGFGTVGQSFAPLPSNLTEPMVLDQTDGDLFYKISLGYNRHPPLAATVAVDHRWAIIRYMRDFAAKQKGQPANG